MAAAVRLATVVSESARGVVLFLPAAGLRNGGGLDRSGIANFYNSRTFAEWFWAQEAGFRAPYVTNTHHRAYSVRLASVVSDLAEEQFFCSCLQRDSVEALEIRPGCGLKVVSNQSPPTHQVGYIQVI